MATTKVDDQIKAMLYLKLIMADQQEGDLGNGETVIQANEYYPISQEVLDANPNIISTVAVLPYSDPATDADKILLRLIKGRAVEFVPSVFLDKCELAVMIRDAKEKGLADVLESGLVYKKIVMVNEEDSVVVSERGRDPVELRAMRGLDALELPSNGQSCYENNVYIESYDYLKLAKDTQSFSIFKIPPPPSAVVKSIDEFIKWYESKNIEFFVKD